MYKFKMLFSLGGASYESGVLAEGHGRNLAVTL